MNEFEGEFEMELPWNDVYAVLKLKNIAKITLCGAIFFYITDAMEWTPPTQEQIKALHDTFCIDVEILED